MRTYYRLAVSCTHLGICPPLSSRPSKVEKGWREQAPGGANWDPHLYIDHDESVDLMFMDILPFLDREARILEIGCNAGRNINYLFSKGYKYFTGIEIGVMAEQVMQEHFPEAYTHTTYIIGNAYEELLKLPSAHYDLVFAHSVLVNIAPKWNGIFAEMARVSKAYILTMESEGGITAFPRDFEKMFRKIGWRQILYKFYHLEGNKRTLAPLFRKDDILRNNTLRLFVRAE